jgi:FPC/CPF motif-containing protein YcgG
MLTSQKDFHSTGISFSWAHQEIEMVLEKFKAEPGTREGFPCIFGQNSVRRGNVKFLLVPFLHNQCVHDYRSLASDLRAYLESINVSRLDINRHQPLLVMFQPVKEMKDVNDFRKVFLDAMQYLIDHDERPWPEHISKNPSDESWTMCFHGCEIFVNVSHPAHVKRRSRNMGNGLVFVLNPRKIFDVAAPDNRQGASLAAKIRANIAVYDDISHSPLLGSYVLNEAQWQQYMIPDDNDSLPLSCPLKFR